MNGCFEENECLILDDNELNSLSHRLQWRNKDAKNIQNLFQEAKGKRAFPSAFQTFKAEGSSFPYYKNDKKVQEKPIKLEGTVKYQSIDHPQEGGQSTSMILGHQSSYQTPTPRGGQSLVLSGTLDLSGIVLDAEYISKHGIPLLKMPQAKEIDFRPIDLEPLAKPDELFNYDSDSNYPYSQCTPPTTD